MPVLRRRTRHASPTRTTTGRKVRGIFRAVGACWSQRNLYVSQHASDCGGPTCAGQCKFSRKSVLPAMLLFSFVVTQTVNGPQCGNRADVKNILSLSLHGTKQFCCQSYNLTFVRRVIQRCESISEITVVEYVSADMFRKYVFRMSAKLTTNQAGVLCHFPPSLYTYSRILP